MAPDPGAKAKLRTVGVPFARLVPDAAHAQAIGDGHELSLIHISEPTRRS